LRIDKRECLDISRFLLGEEKTFRPTGFGGVVECLAVRRRTERETSGVTAPTSDCAGDGAEGGVGCSDRCRVVAPGGQNEKCDEDDTE